MGFPQNFPPPQSTESKNNPKHKDTLAVFLPEREILERYMAIAGTIFLDDDANIKNADR